MKKYMTLPGPENVVAPSVSITRKARCPFINALKRPVASLVSNRSAIVPFVKSWLKLAADGSLVPEAANSTNSPLFVLYKPESDWQSGRCTDDIVEIESDV